jgi:hypothetical protein
VRIRSLAVSGLLSLSALFVAALPAAAATHSPSIAPQAEAPVVILVSAPCIVTGYSLHAAEEMEADSLTADTVEDVVYNTCSRARRQSNGTWKYTQGRITVVCNDNGYVVTAWRD